MAVKIFLKVYGPDVLFMKRKNVLTRFTVDLLNFLDIVYFQTKSETRILDESEILRVDQI